jgi:rare lipoprotein A
VRPAKPRLDRSGRQRTGKASIYAHKFDGRKMADGTRMDPQDDNAASKTLPLGTTARVTNTETGQSAIVTIRDRGPHVPGRIVDLSPATAEKVGLDRQQGIAKVVVKPISLPPSDDASGARGASQDAKQGGRGTGSPESR